MSFKNLIDKVIRIDSAFNRRKIYHFYIAAVMLVMFVVFFDCFSSNKVVKNYPKDHYSFIRISANNSYSQEFEAQSDVLKSFRIVSFAEMTKLKTSDKATIVIEDEEGNTIFDKQVFLYNGKRNYIPVECDSLTLKTGNKYLLTINLDSVDKNSYIVVKTHKTSEFLMEQEASREDSDIEFDEENDSVQITLANDSAVGFTRVINIAYYYQSTDLIYSIIHFLFYSIFVSLLFIDRFMQKRVFREIYRAFGTALFLYLVGEILNVENHRIIRIFGPMTLKHWYCLIASFIVIVVVYFFFYMVVGRGYISSIVTGLLFATIAFVNHTKLVMRGDTFMPWDLYAAGIAVKTGSTYYFHVTRNFIVAILLFVAFLCFIRICNTPRYRFSRERFAYLALSVALVCLSFTGVVLNTRMLDRLCIYYDVNPPIQSYNENGTYMAFLFHLNNLNAKGSINNSPEVTNELIYKYQAIAKSRSLDSCVCSTDIKPNVICIMSEAYTDLDNIRELETSEPVTPYFDKICEETRNGELAVSVFGGGTCNTEFEFLTGYSMNSLIPGSSVYSLYVSNDIDALPRLFNDSGYRTVALHSFDGDWWERRQKYPYLGFEEFYTRDDFDLETTEYVRRYISDMDTFEKITNIYEESEEPLFLFCVTMQNHADFSMRYDNMRYDIKLENIVSDTGEHFEYAENYLSLLRESDDALEYLIEYLRDSDEPTIVVFFGDHYPTLDFDFYDSLLNMDIGLITIEDSLQLYNTPYFIWSNYAIDGGLGEDQMISPNFLGQDILDLAGIYSPPERACLRVLKDDISAISSIAIYDKDGNSYVDFSMLPKNLSEEVEDYSSIQYGLIYYDDDSDNEVKGE